MEHVLVRTGSSASIRFCRTAFRYPNGTVEMNRLLWAAAIVGLSAPPVHSELLHVAPGGPWATLEAARDRIRTLRRGGAQGSFTVRVHRGTYYLASPLVLTPEDSGTVYEAAPSEQVIISGGRVIRSWLPGSGKIWTAQIDEGWQPRQLFVSGRRAQRARTPNHGFFRIKGPSSEDKLFQLPLDAGIMRKSWENGQVEAVVLLGWTSFRRPILRIDEDRRLAILAGDSGGSEVGPVKDVDGRYFIENAPEALDEAGEWYLDTGKNIVSYWPAPGENLAAADVVAPRLNQLVRLEGSPDHAIRDIVFRGFEFRHADWGMAPDGYADTPQAAVKVGAAFEAAGAESCTVERCTFSQIGGYAVWFGRGSKRNRVIGNEIYDAGAGGVKIGDTILHEHEAERSFENQVTDNIIHDLGTVYPEAVGIWVGQSSRNEISHNLIHDLSYSGISVGWVWGYGTSHCEGNRIEWNEVYNIGRGTLNDLGGIYTLGTRGGTVRNNLVHDVTCFSERARGIYLDEGTTGLLVENNIVYRCTSSGIHLHYGRENRVRNNISALNEDFQISRAKAEPHRSLTLERNIIYPGKGRALGGAWAQGEVALDHNLYFDTQGRELRLGSKTFTDWQTAGYDKGSTVADPLFVDPARYDFRLRPESPALQLGFKEIDMRAVGPRTLKAR
jgi:parallel beta-helix repeat protein